MSKHGKPHVFKRAGLWRILSTDGGCIAAAPTVQRLSTYVNHPWYLERWA